MKIETAFLKHLTESREVGWKMERGEDSRGYGGCCAKPPRFHLWMQELNPPAATRVGYRRHTAASPSGDASAEGSCLQTVHWPSIP